MAQDGAVDGAAPLAPKHPPSSPSSSFSSSSSSSSSSPSALAPLLLDKKSQILDACCGDDLHRLIALATSEHGLVDDETRRIAWPILLGSATAAADGRDASFEDASWASLPEHRDEHQVQLDVDRSFVYYPRGESDEQIDRRRRDLQHLITLTLRRHPFLCYFQGYHDIVQVLLLVLGRHLAAPAAARLSLLRIRDFMLPTISPTNVHLGLLPSILRCADSAVADHLSHTNPLFALAATLTLYAHDIQEYSDIARLFDFLLAREAIISIYLFAVIICSRKKELLDMPSDEPEMLYSVLIKLPRPLDLESLISRTVALFQAHPPESLPRFIFARVPSCSVLKTTRNPSRIPAQTLEDGRRWFESQAAQLRRVEKLEAAQATAWRYRRPLGAAGAAVLAVAVSYWLRRSGNGGAAVSYLWVVLQKMRLAH